MRMLELTQEEVNHTISRASQIVEQKDGVSDSRLGGYEAYIGAAEEVGIPREAMLQALRERNLLPADAVNQGDMVFAPSADNALYPASVVRILNESSIVIQFLAGSEHTVSSVDIRPFSMVPGRQLQFQHKSMGEGIWCTGRLLEYNTEKRVAKLSYAGSSFTAPITSIRQKAQAVQKAQVPTTVRQLLIRTALIAVAGAGGIGFLLGYLIHAR